MNYSQFSNKPILEARVLHCAKCGEEVTMPSFKDSKPYGYTCYSKLFGKGKKNLYVMFQLMPRRLFEIGLS